MEKDNDELKASAPTEGETGINTAETDTLPDMPAKKQKKKKLSGAYYYTETDEAQLAKASFNRTLAAVIALLLQIVVLMLPQGGLEYVTRELPSYAYAYVGGVRNADCVRIRNRHEHDAVQAEKAHTQRVRAAPRF